MPPRINFTRRSLSIAALLVAALPALGRAADWKVDKSHSTVEFVSTHMMISKVRGEFKEYDGVVVYDGKDPASLRVEGTVQVASINTREPKRDEHLRSDDFFNAEKFPTIRFVTKRVERRGDGWVAIADFTIRDVTKEVVAPLSLRGPITDPWGKQRIGLETSFTINRKDFNILWNKSLDAGGLVVADEVDIVVRGEAVRQ